MDINAGAIDSTEVIRAEAQRFADVLATADPQARVPTCPDWTAADLLWHLTDVHLFWGGVLSRAALTEADLEGIEAAKPPRPETTDAMLPIRERATAELTDQLDRLPDDEPRWSWWEAEQTVGFTRRMQTHEATIHRVDAELTAGLPVSPISTEVAAAGVDHCVDVMWGWLPDWATYRPQALTRLVATDTGQEWLVEVGRWTGTGPESGREFDEIRAARAGEGEPVATVSGTATALDLWCWGRGADVITSGDDAALALLDALSHGID